MAGESPDRSKQHEDSVGSASSVEDEELREAVSAWVRPPSGGSAKGKSAASGAGSTGDGKAAGRPGKDAAEEASGTSGSAGSVAAAVPDDTFKDSPEAGSAEEAEKDDVEEGTTSPAAKGGAEGSGEGTSVPAAADGTEDAGKASSGSAEDASSDDADDAEEAEEAQEAASGSAGDSGKGTGTSAAVGSGTRASAPAAEVGSDSAAEGADGAAAEDASAPASAAAEDDTDDTDDTEDAPAAGTGRSPESASEAAPEGTGKAAAVLDAEDTDGSAEDDESASGSAGTGGAAKDGSRPASTDAGKAAAAGAVAAARGDAESADEDDAEDTGKAAPGSAKDAKDTKGESEATPGPGKGDATPGAEAEGTPLPAPRGDTEGAPKKAPGKPVDTPTTALKSPAAKKPRVDQPTTMLKVGGKAEPAPAERETERTSKFVALKPDLKGPSARVEETRAVPQVGPERTTQQPLPPKPPLDLLAELTNTPPPPETPVRTLVRRVKIWTPLVILLVVILGVVQAMRTLPQPTLALTAKDSYTFEGGKPDIPWPTDGQAALDVQGIGSFGSSGSGKPVPIASVAKVMTAYLILRDHPLKNGAAGPKIAIDKAAQDQSKAGQESTVDVTQGDRITQREALEGVLIASANNVARLLARWDAGSEKAFVAKMNAAAKGLGMSGTTYTDPSGLTNSTVSTAADQVKLAKAAMQQPAFREVAAMMSYTDYKGTYHSNWNQLVGHNNVVGIKTGTTTSALGNLVFAAKQDVGGETRMVIGAVLRQPPGGRENTILSAALDHSDALIRAAQGALRSETVLKKGTVVGYVDDGLGGRTPVEVTEDVKAAGWAGLKVRLSFTSGTIAHTAKAGTEVGSLTVGDGSSAGAVKVPVALRADLAEPGLGAKLTRVG